jgi:small subunit ribosomal protein S13
LVRIVGVDIPNEKHVNISLTYIFGVGRTTADKILDSLSIKRDTKTKDLTEEEVVKIRDYLETKLKIEGDLRREVSQNIKRLIEINSYRGIMHRRGLPVRGQRTHTNARTRKGRKKSVGIRKKD